jgi:hypothetical protein
MMWDERGSHTTEVALSIGLFALIAGFGFFTFGDALAEFFAVFGGGIDENSVPFRDVGTTPLAPPEGN